MTDELQVIQARIWQLHLAGRHDDEEYGRLLAYRSTLERRQPTEAESRAAARTARLAEGPVMVLYHQTSEANAVSILTSGTMLPGRQGQAGAGIYFATSPEATMVKARARGVVLAAEVRLGNGWHEPVHRSGLTGEYLSGMGVDSVSFVSSTGPEVVAYASDQVRPLGIVCYTHGPSVGGPGLGMPGLGLGMLGPGLGMFRPGLNMPGPLSHQ